MVALHDVLDERIWRFAASSHLMILHGSETPIPADGSDAIIAGVPELHLDAGEGAYRGNRSRLCLDNGRANVLLLARWRPPAGGPALRVQFGLDRAGSRVPVSALDPERRVLQILIDLRGATIWDLADGSDPVETLFDVLVGQPVRELLENEAPPRVGPGVAEKVAVQMHRLPQHGRDLLKREMSALERLLDLDLLPHGLHRSLHFLSQFTGDAPPPVAEPSPEAVAEEVRRLERLVASRACAALRFGETDISGVLNPVARSRFWQNTIFFHLNMGRCVPIPTLRIYDAGAIGSSDSPAACLGMAKGALRCFERYADVYALVDAVLNFAETNHIAAMPLTRTRRRVSPSAAALFAALFL